MRDRKGYQKEHHSWYQTRYQSHNKHKNDNWFNTRQTTKLTGNFHQSFCGCETSSWKTLWHTSLATIHSGLVCGESNNDIATKPERIIKIKITSRSVVFSINCYTLYICRHTRWYFMSYGPLLVTFWQLKMSMLNFSCSTLNIKPKISSSLNAVSSSELDSNLSDRG